MTGRGATARAVVVLAVALAVAACGGSSTPAASPGSSGGATGSAPGPLKGLFKITAGVCGTGGVTSGSWFRMVQPNGKATTGPFVTNGDSSCTDKTWTPLSPGTAGGLETGGYQPQPAAQFDGAGNSLAGAITAPTTFFAVKFGLSTNPVDPQTHQPVPAPSLTYSGGALTGQLEALAASWNHQQFNQGAPKPGGGTPGLTAPPHGTYNPTTRAFTLDWSSQIVGGPFNNFTGIWHLAGVFQPS
jgi:hypothetical protein